jgi:hypothetical protein
LDVGSRGWLKKPSTGRVLSSEMVTPALIFFCCWGGRLPRIAVWIKDAETLEIEVLHPSAGQQDGVTPVCWTAGRATPCTTTSEQESALAMARKLASSSMIRCRFRSSTDPGGRPRLSRSRGEGGCADSGLPGTKSAARHDEASGWLGSWCLEEETAPG